MVFVCLCLRVCVVYRSPHLAVLMTYLVARHSGITSDSAWGNHMWSQGTEPRAAACKTNVLPLVLSLEPHECILNCSHFYCEIVWRETSQTQASVGSFL